MRSRLDVVGIVFGGAGGHSIGNEKWALGFELRPWRRRGAPIEPDGLRLELPMSREAIGRHMNDLVPGRAVAATVVLTGDVVLGNRAATVDGHYAFCAADAELEAAMHALAKPYRLTVEGLGRCRLERPLAVFAARVALGGRRVEALIHRPRLDDDPTSDRQLLEDAARRLTSVAARWSEIVSSAVAAIYEDYVSTWTTGPAVDRATLVAAARADGAEVSGDRTTIYMGMGKRLQGHVIEVRLDAERAIAEVLIAG